MIDWFAVFINNPHHQQYCEWCHDSMCCRYISLGIRCCCLCCLQPATCIWLCFPRTCGNYSDSCNWPSVSLVCRIGQSRLGLAMTVPVWFGLNASLVYGTLTGGWGGGCRPACLFTLAAIFVCVYVASVAKNLTVFTFGPVCVCVCVQFIDPQTDFS